jgi:hypothetical protein
MGAINSADKPQDCLLPPLSLLPLPPCLPPAHGCWQGKVMYTRHVTVSAEDVPYLVRKATGIKSLECAVEITEDYRHRCMTATSKNTTKRNMLICDETMVYRADTADPGRTYFEQTCAMEVMGLPTSVGSKLEAFLSSKYATGIEEGRQVDLTLLEELCTAGKTDETYQTWTEVTTPCSLSGTATMTPSSS